LPDLANTFIQLLEKQSELADFEVFHFKGHYFANGVDIAQETASIAGISDTTIKAMPWLIIKLASPFVTMFRELLEMRYLWNEDVKLDNSKLVAFLGSEPHTPTDKALTQTLKSLDCL
jgi:nucleoside-diphosphate-sugar epimerase